MSEKLGWKVHTLELLKEILNNPECSSLKIPLNIFKDLLAQVAQRATELNDLQLNKLMIRLALYSIADPTDPDYDSEAVTRILNEKITQKVTKILVEGQTPVANKEGTWKPFLTIDFHVLRKLNTPHKFRHNLRISVVE